MSVGSASPPALPRRCSSTAAAEQLALPHPFFGAALCTPNSWALTGPQMLKCWPFPAPASWTAPAASPISAALDTARTAGVPVCFVPSLRPALWPSEKTLRDTVMQFLPFADLLFLTADEMELLLDTRAYQVGLFCPATGAYPAGGASDRRGRPRLHPGSTRLLARAFRPARRAGRTAAVSNLSAGTDPEKAHEMQCSGTSDTSITPESPRLCRQGLSVYSVIRRRMS